MQNSRQDNGASRRWHQRLAPHQWTPLRQFQLSLLAVVLLLVVGTGGYMLLEGMSIVDGLYMTVITLTTVGFGEVRPLSGAGRLFTMALILWGVGTAAWGLRNAAEVLLGDRFWHSLAVQRMEEQLRGMEGHYIICGYGRMGREVVAEMQRREKPFVVVDQDSTISDELLEAGITYVIGDATHDDALVAAGIERARGLVAVVNSDADNLMIVLSAKGLNPNATVVARASTDEAEKKLRRAGADRVLSPYAVGGLRMALALLRPAVNEFLNTVIYSERLHIEMGELVLAPNSPLVGLTLRACGLRDQWNATVVAIKDREGALTISPSSHYKLAAGDTLILVAPTESLRELEARSL